MKLICWIKKYACNFYMAYTNRGTYIMMFEHKTNENSNLSFSNKERHTLEYKLYVKASCRNSKRLSTCFDLLLKSSSVPYINKQHFVNIQLQMCE
jgi:hypothetical protein